MDIKDKFILKLKKDLDEKRIEKDIFDRYINAIKRLDTKEIYGLFVAYSIERKEQFYYRR